MAENEIVDFAKTQLTLPEKIDPSDAMSWQHHLYSKLGTKKPSQVIVSPVSTNAKTANQQALLDELVERIVAMAKVLYGLHVVSTFMSISIIQIPSSTSIQIQFFQFFYFYFNSLFLTFLLSFF